MRARVEGWGSFRRGGGGGCIGWVGRRAGLVCWRRGAGKQPVHRDGKTPGTILVAVVGALLLGVGMCLSMVFELMVPGIVVGLMGIVALLMLIPLTRGLKD